MVLDDASFSIPNGVLQNRHISFRAIVALELLVLLMSWFGACARIGGDGDRHTHRHTDTQTHVHRPSTRAEPIIQNRLYYSTFPDLFPHYSTYFTYSFPYSSDCLMQKYYNIKVQTLIISQQMYKKGTQDF